MKKSKLIIFAIFGFFLFVISFPKVLAYEYNRNWDGEDFTPYLDQIVVADLSLPNSIYEDGSWPVYVYIDDLGDLFQFHKENDFSPEIKNTIIDDRDWSPDGFWRLFGVDLIYWNPWEQFWQLDNPISPDFKPVFEGETAFVTNLDNPISVLELLSRIKLIDPEDGDVSQNIEFDIDNIALDQELGFVYWDENQNGIYDVGDLICYFQEGSHGYVYPSTPGNYYIKLMGYDYSGNYAYLTVMILVKDITEPVISGQSNYQQSYTKKLNIDTIKNGLTVTDNYDSVLQIVLDSDNYSSNYNRLGFYNVVFSATDSSGNKGTFTVNINVVDDVAPVFSGPASVLKGKSEVLTVDDIKDMLTANDFIDGEVEITVKEDNYSGKGNRVGTYKIIFQAIDSAGNIGLHEVEITVSDNIPPVFYVDNYFITVEQSLILTREDIIAILQASGQLNIQSSTNIQFLLNEYEGNETVVGIYGITVKASSVDGSGQIFNLAVQVVEDEEGTVVRPGDPWYKQIGGWFVKAWDWLKQPVKEESWLKRGYVVGFVGILLVLGFVRAFSSSGRRYRRRW